MIKEILSSHDEIVLSINNDVDGHKQCLLLDKKDITFGVTLDYVYLLHKINIAWLIERTNIIFSMIRRLNLTLGLSRPNIPYSKMANRLIVVDISILIKTGKIYNVKLELKLYHFSILHQNITQNARGEIVPMLNDFIVFALALFYYLTSNQGRQLSVLQLKNLLHATDLNYTSILNWLYIFDTI